MKFDAVTIIGTGSTVTASATSNWQNLPTDATNNVPRYCRLQSTGLVYVKLGGPSGVTATTNDLLLSPNEAVIIATRQFTRIAYLQETPGAKLNIISVEA